MNVRNLQTVVKGQDIGVRVLWICPECLTENSGRIHHPKQRSGKGFHCRECKKVFNVVAG